ncbi:uncharacterized protein SETTUDRAFT_31921 [Exserohilum turcica Et28A]|uniref:F-box domain-containing protein n=1 Tax=Exserohilum turcicum (strain 28A) TaxID=671987 RepID=R0K586_EXST2|nr:uncharacterized protein SETTUDRAFT_31921 [Exserohilum turcica Et28A]EOA84669.1 hypothetical protein SETTUDRAFT_31921 [Exserohilum turcica Et28A]
MRTSVLGLSGYASVLWNWFKSSPPIQDTANSSPSDTSSFSRLPAEVVLNVCEHLSAHDLWNNARPASRQLAACAKEVLPRKVFQGNSSHVSWCCFWCSLGEQNLITACKPITSLFANEKSLHFPVLSDYALIATLVFGDLCNLTAGREPHIRIRLGEDEGDGVTVGTEELQRQLRWRGPYSVQDLQSHQREFLVWYYAKRRKERARGRIMATLAFTAHTLRFLAMTAALLISGMAFALIFCVTLYTCRIFRNFYRRINNLVRFCVGKEPLYD